MTNYSYFVVFVIFLYLTLYKAEPHFYPLKTNKNSNLSNGPDLKRMNVLYEIAQASTVCLSDKGRMKMRMNVEP